MTRKELAEKQDEFQRTSRKCPWPLAVAAIGGFVGFFVIILFFQTSEGMRFLLLGLLGGIILPQVLLFERKMKKLAIRLGLTCPQCQILLVGPVGRFAVTTLSCRQCGSKVLEDD